MKIISNKDYLRFKELEKENDFLRVEIYFKEIFCIRGINILENFEHLFEEFKVKEYDFFYNRNAIRGVFEVYMLEDNLFKEVYSIKEESIMNILKKEVKILDIQPLLDKQFKEIRTREIICDFKKLLKN